MTNFKDINVIASSRGRIRVAIGQLYRSPALQAQIEKEFSRRRAVIAVYANPLTAHVLILFDPALRRNVLLAELGLAIREDDTSGDNDTSGEHDTRAQRDKLPPPVPARAKTAAARDGAAAQRPGYAPWHLRDADAALAYFASSRQAGLSDKEAQARLRLGQNVLSRPPPISSLEILLDQFKNLPVLLLGVSATIAAVTGGVAEAAAIVAVLGLNGGIGFSTERRAQSTIASLSELIDDVVPVLRAGQVRQIQASQVVPGDVLALAPGIRIAADVRLLRCDGLTVDESALTGESMPASKQSGALPRPVALAERSNMAYRGTAVAAGSGLGLVVGTGNRTEVGAIEALASTATRPKTPLQQQLDQLGNRLVVASGAICLGIFAFGLLRGYRWLQMFKTATSLAIAALPEGLPAVATTALARGIRKMREHQVLIRRLHAVETVGAIQTICLDKTGTLTMNRMSAVAVQTSSHTLRPDAPASNWPPRAAKAELGRLLQICVLCNQSELNGAGFDTPLNGSATEIALLELAAKAGIAVAPTRARFTLLATQLRTEGCNYMRTVHAGPGPRQRLIAVKGSPLEVLALCSHTLVGARAQELDAHALARIIRHNDAMAKQQLRVLGFAYAEAPEDAEPADQKLTWVGLVGLADPLRPGVERTIAAFHAAGIRTVMLTGDQAATAYVIGKSLHLNNSDELHIVNSERIDRIAPEHLHALTANAHIFSRVTPSHKLQIVRALQHGGKIVAMTGDGINDGPALRVADIGIAMGGGTDLALSVADIVLKDDRLETVLEAVSQGRTVANNIGKSLHFLLSSNLSEILVVTGSVALGTGQPLTPMRLLWLNLLSDMLPAIALAAEPAQDDVMRQPPRDPRQIVMDRQALGRYGREGACLAGGAMSAYMYGAWRYGASARAGTIAFNALALGQLLHAFSCRSERRALFGPAGAPLRPNRQLTLTIAASVGMQVLANLLPGLRRVLGIAPLGLADIAATLAGAGIPLLLNEMAKPGAESGQMQGGGARTA